MKNAAIVIVTSIMLLTIVSCEDMMGDFLEKAPGVDVTEDTIFSSRLQVEMFLASIYEYGVHSNLGLGSPDNGAPAIANSAGTIVAGATDEKLVLIGMILKSGITPLLVLIIRMILDFHIDLLQYEK